MWNIVYIYFLLIRIAALFGHRKAQLLVRGEREAMGIVNAWRQAIGDAPVLWFHAASVGEFEQARPIIERLRKEQPQYKILLTFFSPSGYELRKNYDQVDAVCYLPFATRRKAKQFMDTVRPSKVVFVKYEFWPAYLYALQAKQVPTYLISAIFRPKQYFFRWWGKPWLPMLRCFTQVFVQDEASRQLLVQHGVTAVEVAGDTRFDRVTAIAQQKKELHIVERFIAPPIELMDAQKVLVAGSTWPKDEELLARYMREHEDVKLILAPHEINKEHLDYIFQLFEGRFVRYTEATPVNILHTRVLLVDTIGVLSSLYRYGQVAYVGGGFGVGIHNTIEAAVYGIPVLFGTNYHAFREAKGLIDAGAAVSVRNYKELTVALDATFETYEQMGQKAKAYVESELGATEHIMKAIF